MVNTAKRSLSRVKRNTALHEIRIQPLTFEFLPAPAARKKSALVVLGLEVNLKNSA
jgi:hypothetical protein